MISSFLFWLFLIGILIATFQDLKRTEVDRWLCLFLIFSSFVYISYLAYFSGNLGLVFSAIFLFLFVLVLENVLYSMRVFAGGDATLLLAMSLFFLGSTFYASLLNVGLFVFLLMLSGAIYGLIYSLVLYFMNLEKVSLEFWGSFRKFFWIWIVLSIFVLVISTFDFVFLSLGIIIVLLIPLYFFSKGLEKVVMVKSVSGKNLREGDWLVEDVHVGKKTIKANFDGLTLSDLKLLRKKKSVKIKCGIPFVPAFLIAFLIYVFLKNYLLAFLIKLV